MYPLTVFVKPRSSIARSFEKPDLMLAVFLVILPALISVAGTFLFGLNIDVAFFALAILSQVILWMVVTIVFYLIIYAFRGQEVRKKIPGLASAVALTRMASIGLVMIALIFPAMLPASIWENIAEFQAGNLTGEEFVEGVSSVIDNEAASFNLLGMQILMVLGVILAILYFYWHYLIVSHLANYGVVKNFLIWAVLMVLVFFVSVPFSFPL